MKVIDPGHLYALFSLDNDGTRPPQVLRFVKRFDPNNPDAYPGNYDKHEGTTTQSVMRALLERTRYVNAQKPCDENEIVIEHLRDCLVQLETRAMRRHGIFYDISPELAETGEMCAKCGHIVCKHTVAEYERAKGLR